MARNREAGTAFGPIAISAIEYREPAARRLVDDDLAAAFLPLALRAFVGTARSAQVRRAIVAGSERVGPGLWADIACRKRYVDDNLAEAIDDIDAVVVLGAGLDTRGARISRRTDVPVFEVDQPVNVSRKRAVLTRVLGGAPPSLSLVPVDFEREDPMAELARHGYRSAGRTFFVWEGVTQYLTLGAVDAMFASLSQAAPGSKLDFTYVRQDFIDGTQMYGARTLYRKFRGRHQVWKSGFAPERIADYLDEHGWNVLEHAGPDEFLQRYVRPTGRSLTVSPLEMSVYAEKR
jgi:methyltransferase (TIGR00027 family)